MSLPRVVILGLLLEAFAACADLAMVPASPSSVPDAAAWADEFDGPAGTLPDPGSWTFDLGNNRGWGNNELQRYTSDAANVSLDGQGHLALRARSTPEGFTSARIKTLGLRQMRFGRIEARIKTPQGRGIWPAFWMLGGSFNGSNWPLAGEIDIAEFRGSDPAAVHATVHGPGYSGGAGISGSYALPRGSFTDDFHTFAVIWAPGSIRFTVDEVPYHAVTRDELQSGALWVFDQPFFLLLNIAVGGNFVGAPDSTTHFPQEMLVDYVRYSPTP